MFGWVLTVYMVVTAITGNVRNQNSNSLQRKRTMHCQKQQLVIRGFVKSSLHFMHLQAEAFMIAVNVR